MATKLNDFLQLVDGQPLLMRALQSLLTDLATDTANIRDRMKCQMFSVSTPVIKSGGSALSKTGAAITYGVANGTAVKIAAGTDNAAYAGSVTTTKFNVFVHYIDAASALTTVMGTEGATLAAVVWPATVAAKSAYAYTIINPSGTGSFVGGTTALDDGTVIPNAVYVPIIGAFDPKTINAFTNT